MTILHETSITTTTQTIEHIQK